MEQINRNSIAKRRDIDEGIAEDQRAGGIIFALFEDFFHKIVNNFDLAVTMNNATESFR